MPRRLSAEERALWAKVIDTVRPLHGALPPAEAISSGTETIAAPSLPRAREAAPPKRTAAPRPQPGTTLDGSWDRRLSRGMVQPDMSIDLHGHNLATAYAWLDRSLERAISEGCRTLLLITGKPPKGEPPVARGKIRAAVGDWLGASRHAADIAAVRNAHPRHGGAGALYIVLRRRK